VDIDEDAFESRRPTFNSFFETLHRHAKEKASILDNSFFFADPASSDASSSPAPSAPSAPTDPSAPSDPPAPTDSSDSSAPLAPSENPSAEPESSPLMKTLLEDTLNENGLGDCIPVFQEAEVDLDAFLLLTMKDLEELGFNFGTRKKLSIVSKALSETIEGLGGSENQKQLSRMLSHLRKNRPPSNKKFIETAKKKKKKKDTDGSSGDKSKKRKKKKKEIKDLTPEEKEEILLQRISQRMEISDESDNDFEEGPSIPLNPTELFPEPGFDQDESRRKSEVAKPNINDTGSRLRIEKMPDITADSLKGAQMQGWLLKQGGKIQGWKKRWCVLKDRCFYYFPSPTNSKPKGMFLLPSYEIQLAQTELKKDFAFRAYHQTARTYYFVANNSNDLDLWLKALKEATQI